MTDINKELRAILEEIESAGRNYDNEDANFELAIAKIKALVVEARAEEVERILKECDFDAYNEQFKEYHRIAGKEWLGYCILCGHDSLKLKEWFTNRLGEIRSIYGK